MDESVLAMRDIRKGFAGVEVLHGVSLEVRPGEVHALVGENGAGKSTLMKILAGMYSADDGQIALGGATVAFSDPADAIHHGVAMIHQELNPILDMTVAENIFVGREVSRHRLWSLGVVDDRAQVRKAQEIIDSLGIELDVRQRMRNLSIAQAQLVEIAKAISLEAKIVIMDEPTSALSQREVAHLFEQVAKLRASGVAIVYISHRLEEIFQIADRITVLRDGQNVGGDDAAQLDRAALIRMMVGREITEVFPKRVVEWGDVVLEVDGLTRIGHFSDVSFPLHAGEILGIAGLVGAGRSELVECLFGVTRPTSGSVRVHGREVRIDAPEAAIGHRMALITEDRKSTGLNMVGTVRDNIALGSLSRLARLGVMDTGREAEAADKYIRALSIKGRSSSAITSLSGGNQQKVVLGKWLLTDPEIVILDEPTRGIDVGAKRDIYLLIGDLVAAGNAVLMVSSEIPELMGLADRILVLAAGRQTGTLERDSFTQEAIMHLAAAFQAEAVQ